MTVYNSNDHSIKEDTIHHDDLSSMVEAPVNDEDTIETVATATATTTFPTSDQYLISVLDRIAVIENQNQYYSRQNIWSDRIMLQNTFTLKEKGWQVQVEWKDTNKGYGIGVYAKEFIPAGTILRIGRINHNLFQFTSVEDIEKFCNQKYSDDENESFYSNDRLNYVKDYLWGYTSNTDDRGYPLFSLPSSSSDNAGDISTINNQPISMQKKNKNAGTCADTRFFGMWIPGNGLNHNPIPNTVYRSNSDDNDNNSNNSDVSRNMTIYLIALTNIQVGDELHDDYQRHGMAPSWLKEYAQRHNITLNFADCNSFVGYQ